MPEAQLEAGRKLIEDIVLRYPSIVVAKHKDFSQTACLGRNFPFAEITEKNSESYDVDAEETGSPDAWAQDACDFAVQNGIFKGDENSAFHWRKSITRQELAVVIERLCKKSGILL